MILSSKFNIWILVSDFLKSQDFNYVPYDVLLVDNY